MRHLIDYRDELAPGIDIAVRFTTDQGRLVSYTVLLLAREAREWRTIRVYDNSHGANEMHRYTREAGKQRATSFHQGTAAEAMNAAK
jgi:hypothetical protein